MKKLLLSILLAASTLMAATETISATEHITDAPYGVQREYSATFNIANKALVSDDMSLFINDDAGVSILNKSRCIGPTTCPTSILNESFSIDGDELTVAFTVYIGQNPYYYYGYEVSYDVQISYTESGAFDPTTNSFAVTLPETEWAIIHMNINGRLENYTMTKSGDNFSATILIPVFEDDVVTYTVTVKPESGAVYDSEESSFVVPAMPVPPVAPEFLDVYIASYYIGVTTFENIDWIIAHYSVNGRAYENVVMHGNNAYWSVSSAGLVDGDVVDYFFTYFKDGYATDSDKKQLFYTTE